MPLYIWLYHYYQHLISFFLSVPLQGSGISPDSITFHYVTADQMRMLYFFLYHWRANVMNKNNTQESEKDIYGIKVIWISEFIMYQWNNQYCIQVHLFDYYWQIIDKPSCDNISLVWYRWTFVYASWCLDIHIIIVILYVICLYHQFILARYQNHKVTDISFCGFCAILYKKYWIIPAGQNCKETLLEYDIVA